MAFQSTRPRGARLGVPYSLLSETKFQSTRPRGARLILFCVVSGCMIVSIHAPAGGATLQRWASLTPRLSFNPRARGGRDSQVTASPSKLSLFQSTRPRGARQDGLAVEERGCAVSIHAPAGGATQFHCSSLPPIHSFNPRARGGRDAKRYYRSHANCQFQSTRPRGARLAHECLHAAFAYVSIHAPAGGATKGAGMNEIARLKFQSTRPRGARQDVGAKQPTRRSVSIHAPAGGAT